VASRGGSSGGLAAAARAPAPPPAAAAKSAAVGVCGWGSGGGWWLWHLLLLWGCWVWCLSSERRASAFTAAAASRQFLLPLLSVLEGLLSVCSSLGWPCFCLTVAAWLSLSRGGAWVGCRDGCCCVRAAWFRALAVIDEEVDASVYPHPPISPGRCAQCFVL
jgi:hypothetical protein